MLLVSLTLPFQKHVQKTILLLNLSPKIAIVNYNFNIYTHK